MKLTITKLFKSDKDKAGKPLIGKNGPYMKLAVKCREYGDRWVSGFVGTWNQSWNEGDVVDADVEEKGGYLNLHRPDPLAEMAKAIFNLGVEQGKLKKRVEVLEARLVKQNTQNTPNTQNTQTEPIIPVINEEFREQPVGFDESGAPIFDEPDIQPLADKDLPF